MNIFIRQIALLDYKSIARCDVRLGRLTFLVGQNGAGKSNFVDALRFVGDALRTSLDQAVRERGGIKDLCRRGGQAPARLSLRLTFSIPGAPEDGYYALMIGARPRGGVAVLREAGRLLVPILVAPGVSEWREERFSVQDGQLIHRKATRPHLHWPPAAPDRLYLSQLGHTPFLWLMKQLSRVAIYNFQPELIRQLQKPDHKEMLERDGRNLAGVLQRMSAPARERIDEYLAKIIPDLCAVDTMALTHEYETLEFRQRIQDGAPPASFLAANMSDGTLRALGILVALFQSVEVADPSAEDGLPGLALVGIEEPEAALHPAAMGVLLSALREAAAHTQVLVTSHSPDLLDDKDIQTDQVLAVSAERGVTRISPLDDAARASLSEHLYSAGELLRMNQLLPQEESPVDPRIFDEDPT